MVVVSSGSDVLVVSSGSVVVVEVVVVVEGGVVVLVSGGERRGRSDCGGLRGRVVGGGSVVGGNKMSIVTGGHISAAATGRAGVVASRALRSGRARSTGRPSVCRTSPRPYMPVSDLEPGATRVRLYVMMSSRALRFSLSGLLILALAACDDGETTDLSTTSSLLASPTTGGEVATTTTVAPGGDTTSTSLVGEPVASYEVVARVSRPRGRDALHRHPWRGIPTSTSRTS